MIGVTTFIGKLHKEKDWDKIAKEKAKDLKKSVEEIKAEWKSAEEKGTRLHEQLQSEEEGKENVESYHNTFEKDSEGKLIMNLPEVDIPLENNRIYLERPVFSHKQGLLGYPDRIEVVKNTINITDIKTWKTLYRSATPEKKGPFWEKPKMFAPIDHLDDCNFIHAILQLSLYMYILWENNRRLKPGILKIRHVITNQKDEIIREEYHEVPYLREEVKEILKYKKLNKL